MKVHPFILSIIAAESFKSLSYGWGIFALKALWFGPPIYSVKSVFRQENKTNLEYTLNRPGPAAHEFLVVAFLCQNTVVIR